MPRAEPATHQYPSNRGRPELREAFARFYDRRFGVTLDAETEVIPALGAKECIFNLNLAFLDPGTVALAADPGYPVYTGGPLLAGAEPELMPLLPERGFAPDLDAIPAEARERARLMYLNYPNNPTGAVVPEGLFRHAVDFAREHDILVVHDASYTETTFDGYVAPSFLETPGAKDVGVEVFSLSKGYNMTGWRTAAIVGNAEAVAAYWKLKTNIDSGMFEPVQLAAAAALDRGDEAPKRMSEIYQRRRDLVVGALREIGVDVATPQGHDLRVGPGARRPHLGLLLRARARGVGRGGLAGQLLRPQRRGLLPDLADGGGRAAQRGCGADANQPVVRVISRTYGDLGPSRPRRGRTQAAHPVLQRRGAGDRAQPARRANSCRSTRCTSGPGWSWPTGRSRCGATVRRA